MSEASYQKSLIVALNVFQCSTELKQTLSRVQHHVLFSNLKDVCRVSEWYGSNTCIEYSILYNFEYEICIVLHSLNVSLGILVKNI